VGMRVREAGDKSRALKWTGVAYLGWIMEFGVNKSLLHRWEYGDLIWDG
jgi:hypothetical protein